ncbi:MAG: efflux RND transporter periplasmic adaptor subunit [Pseudomonadota bacterium]
MNDAIAAPTNARRKAFRIFGILLAVVAVAWLLYWNLALRHYESTEDAYVTGDVIAVTSEVPGTVQALHVADMAHVHQGDVLVELDPTDARLALVTAEAELDRTARDVASHQAQENLWKAMLTVRQVALARAKQDLARREGLDRDGTVAAEDVVHANEAVAEQTAAVAAATAQVGVFAAELQGTRIETHPRVVAAAVAVRNAALALARTRILAPTDGVVARKAVQVGQRIAPGVPLFAVADLEHVWVDANFKEVQLGRLKFGQPATLHSDVYGSDVEFHGRVTGFSAGSGAAFALLPAQNASGNWIKVVQRVPVHIALDPKDLQAHPLRVGLSTTVRVDLSAVIDASVAPQRTRTLQSAPMDPAVEARIASLIAQARLGVSPRHR